ncbi:DeoR/GlpR family DNA-binding transcription regulator [Amycolatopsis rhabdoformis]|uniref:DeoR/GlpR family DNA-binding transcription regulator n=1 Tax=Amycolatopsis rhabdoformis TaxID=1448059 RepID=A0ABZ1HXZ5_9PSEU|nr:DeoR/GlpR family DNA-binding transcription regulator [Amycolatopsis rhabdoformis]WSE26396.1 DeoR/GlpR family DNA-binding transcription regulator [Amycolatopsis rhabdoformis]
MRGNPRHEHILERLRRDGRVDVGELAVALDTSEVTIRRDLDALAEQGTLRRVRGGAVSLLMRGEELPFALREVESAAAKDRIAAVVGGLVRDGEAVVVDSGTSGLAVARVLGGRRLTVMPLALPSAAVLSASSSVNLLLPGGTTRFGEGSMVGPLAEAAVAALRFDTFVLTCCGLSPDDGITAHDLQDAAVKRAARRSSRRTVLVAESAKFSRTALATVCGIEEVDVLVTDAQAPADALARFREAGVDVRVA